MYERELEEIVTCREKNCTLRTNENTKIQKIANNVILGINLRNIKIVNNCDDRKIELSGNYLLSLTNCSIIIENTVYEHVSKEFVNDR